MNNDDIDEIRLVKSKLFLKLGNRSMGVHFTILSNIYFEIFYNKKKFKVT